MKMFVKLFLVMSFVGFASPAGAATLIDYFLPTPIYDKLESNAWGAAGVVPREQHNGLEDMTLAQYVYWDGKIIKGPDGKYHLFASRWAQSSGHGGWSGSVAVHAVSDTPTGPYVDKGICWPSNSNGKGHNVTALELLDGTYAVLVSDTRPGDIFTSPSLDGPWTYRGSITIDANGFSAPATKNLSFVVRPDGSYLMVSKHGIMMVSTSGITGPYKVQGNSVFPQAYDNANEDPVLWYSGGKYHIVFNFYNARKALHLTSTDGINNWTNMGLAFDPTTDMVRYTDGTVNHWTKMERPGVLIENGHVTHFTFAVIDVEKTQDVGNDSHGSKVIVVPFDGVGLDNGSAPGSSGGTGGGAGGTGGTSGTGGATGSGGRAGTGGATAGGGRTGIAGATAIGGTPGSGGRAGAGGATAIGGAPATGGTAGSGGGTAIGGAPATGGTTATGGAAAIGGAPATGGTTATSGTTAIGGASASGGATSTGGGVATGGSVATGGAIGTGGSVATAGAIGTGGLSGAGGALNTGPVGVGGSAATGGTPGTGIAGSTTTATGTTQASAGGCSCRIAGTPTRSYPGLALLGLVVVALRLRKRR
jgi:MYXO-CTERM domain-containing protein